MPTLDALIQSRHDLVTVVSQPDRGRGRGRKLSPSPVSARARAENIPLLRPEKIGDPDVLEALKDQTPDLGVVVAFGQFIGRPIRELPSLGYLINAHASLLPRHRGASPVAQAILDGESHTGISIMRVEREMDAGDVGLMRKVEIREHENAAELSERLAQVAAGAVLDAIDLIQSGEINWKQQDAERASLAPKLAKEDGRIDWQLPTQTLIRRIHGLAPRPGAFSTAPKPGGGPSEPLRILRAQAWDGPSGDKGPPGTIRTTGGQGGEKGLRVATGDGWLVPLEVQRAGSKAMPTSAFLRGHPLPDGLCLGDEHPQEKNHG